MDGGGVANGDRAAAEEPANGQRVPRASSNGDGGSLEAANEEPGGACTVGEPSNEGRGSPSSANEGRGGQRGPANEDTGHKDAANEIVGHKGPANDTAGPPSAANEEAEPHELTNEHSEPGAPANEDAASEPAANEDAPPVASANGRAAGTDPAPLPAPSNGASPSRAEELAALPNGDPWDWSREEAWLRAPEEAWPGGQGAGFDEEGAWPEGEELEEEGEGTEGEGWEGEGSPWGGAGGGRGWWVSPDAAIAKRVLRGGRGLGRPGPGSRCRVRLTSAPGTPVLWGGAGGWRTVRVGAGEGRWAAALDAGLETMARGERARLWPAGAGAALGVRLGAFTPPNPPWLRSGDDDERWRAVEAAQAHAAELAAVPAALEAAARAYAGALRLVVAVGGVPPLPPARARHKAELHAGLALCQLRLGLPAAAAANAGKALALSPPHPEARYRRALAAAAMGDLEGAAADLALVLREQPGHAGARRELRRVRGAARERDAQLARRLGRLFA